MNNILIIIKNVVKFRLGYKNAQKLTFKLKQNFI